MVINNFYDHDRCHLIQINSAIDLPVNWVMIGFKYQAIRIHRIYCELARTVLRQLVPAFWRIDWNVRQGRRSL